MVNHEKCIQVTNRFKGIGRIDISWDLVDGLYLDTFSFLLDENEKCLYNEDIVFYGNDDVGRYNSVRIQRNDNMVVDMRENEQILFQFELLPPEIKKMEVYLCIYDGKNRGQYLDTVRNVSMRYTQLLSEYDNQGDVLLDYNFVFSSLKTNTVLYICEFSKSTEWMLKTIGKERDDIMKLISERGIV